MLRNAYPFLFGEGHTDHLPFVRSGFIDSKEELMQIMLNLVVKHNLEMNLANLEASSPFSETEVRLTRASVARRKS